VEFRTTRILRGGFTDSWRGWARYLAREDHVDRRRTGASVETFEARRALRLLAELDAVHADLRRFTDGLMGRTGSAATWSWCTRCTPTWKGTASG